MPFAKIANAVRLFLAACRRNAAEEILAERFAAARARRVPATPSAPLLTVVAPADIVYYAVLGEIVSSLRTRQALRTEQIGTQSLRPGAPQSFRHFLRARLDNNFLTRRKWENLQGLFCDRVGYSTAGWTGPLRALRQWRHAWRLWQGLRDKDQLVAIAYREIVIGDLVIDTYLRLRPSPVIALNDLYLLAVIRQALKDVDLAFAYFRSARPEILFSMYTTYLSHGVPARVALACGTRVITFGNLQEFCTPVSRQHGSHTKASSRYHQDFQALPGQDGLRRQAAAALETRLSGGIDAATAYMKKSAYAVTTDAVPDVRGATVIFLHDFYDSLHIYSWSLFHDFWEWTCFTIEALQAAGHDFWIKPHPNQGAESSTEVEALRRKYPGVKFLPTAITNRQLADAGIARAVTIYGSVAPEMGFLGIPSISTGDSPYASFDAFQLARCRKDYETLLARAPGQDVDIEQLQAQACAVYYMHNLNLDADGTVLRDSFATLWAHLLTAQTDGFLDREKTFKVLASMTGTPAFQRFSDTLISANPP